MGDKSGISWTDASWNPIVGCTKVSAGCKNCYAEKLHDQRHKAWKEGRWDDAPTQYHEPFSTVQLKPERLDMPLRWSKPRRIFVNSVSDLFHEQVPDEFIADVFAVMYLAHRHVFQVLTKRPERMSELLNDRLWWARVEGGAQRIYAERTGADPSYWLAVHGPLPNVWLGVSVENQRAADERIPHLLRTPAAVRFLSCEPLLGPLDLNDHLFQTRAVSLGPGEDDYDFEVEPHEDGIHWVIAGGESGPNHRPMEHDWMRSLRDQCATAGVAFFGKQDAGVRNEMPLPEDLQIREFPEVAR